MTRRQQRVIWGVGFVAYSLVALVSLLAPFLIPFEAAGVLLACTSATGTGLKTDRLVMGAAIAEIAIGSFLSALISTGVPAWIEPIASAALLIGIFLPIPIIIYRIVRPRAGQTTEALTPDTANPSR
jgi:hypothetical protein